jgi:2-polyprenyl-3-methyl-5-hydroxy-6-metoxy-1,4-benzoquinol methylase
MLFFGDVNGYVYPEVYKVFYCNTCNTQSVQIEEYDFTKLYDEIYKNKNINGYTRYWNYAKVIKNKKKPLDFLAQNEGIYYSVFKTVKLYNCKSILEVGSGLGYLTYALNKSGYNCFGVDISKSAVNFSKTEFGDFYICNDIFKFLDNTNNKFDLIVVNEVIEHLENPKDFIQNLFYKLEIGGKILFTTPNKSIFKQETIWATDSPPVHLHWFSEDTIKYMSNQIGFNYELVDFSDFYKNRKFTLNLDKAKIIKKKKFIFNSDFSVIDNRSSIFSFLRKIIKFCFNDIYCFYLKKKGVDFFIGGKSGKTLAFIITKNKE